MKPAVKWRMEFPVTMLWGALVPLALFMALIVVGIVQITITLVTGEDYP